MKTIENTFVRGPSPSYSDDLNSENAAMSATLPIDSMSMKEHQPVRKQKHFLKEFCNLSVPHESKSSVKQGRHTFAFWAVVLVLLVLTVGNLILTLTIIGVLRLGKGIYGMELIPEEDVIKFFGCTDLDRIYSKNVGQFEGFIDEPLTITGDNAAVYVRMHHRNGQIHNRLIVDKSGVQFRGINTLDIKDPETGAVIFTTHRPHYNMPKGANMLLSKSIGATRIASAINQSLAITAPDDRLSIRGSEGIRIDAAAMFLQAEHNLLINSTQGALTLEANSGIYLNMEKIPIVKAEMGLRTGSVQYKLCVCMPQGIVFRIAIPRVHNGPKVSCAHFSAKHDPCIIN
uniref:Beta-sarcoglycan n=1 Tax=Glossina morsitans morsitans TaxID=37546 RepID=A0A1B0GF51_GLOMM